MLFQIIINRCVKLLNLLFMAIFVSFLSVIIARCTSKLICTIILCPTVKCVRAGDEKKSMVFKTLFIG